MKKLPILLITAILAVTLVSTQVYAQSTIEEAVQNSSITLTAIPPRTEVVKVRPGETFQTAVKLKNTSQRKQSITTEAQDFVIGEDGKTPIPITEQAAAPLRWSLASWLTISPVENALEANQTGIYDILIQVPADALPGGHYAMILHTPNAGDVQEKGANSSITAVNQRVGTLLYVVVEGNITEHALIRNFNGPKWVEFGPVDFTFTVENLSDVHITPQSSIEIYDVLGRRMETLSSEKLNIFPYSKRDFTIRSEQLWGFGPYTAKLTVPYGETGKIAQETLVFWMIPYKILLAIGVFILTLLAMIIVIRRHLLHRGGVDTQHIEVLEERIKDLEKQLKK